MEWLLLLVIAGGGGLLPNGGGTAGHSGESSWRSSRGSGNWQTRTLLSSASSCSALTMKSRATSSTRRLGSTTRRRLTPMRQRSAPSPGFAGQTTSARSPTPCPLGATPWRASRLGWPARRCRNCACLASSTPSTDRPWPTWCGPSPVVVLEVFPRASGCRPSRQPRGSGGPQGQDRLTDGPVLGGGCRLPALRGGVLRRRGCDDLGLPATGRLGRRRRPWWRLRRWRVRRWRLRRWRRRGRVRLSLMAGRFAKLGPPQGHTLNGKTVRNAADGDDPAPLQLASSRVAPLHVHCNQGGVASPTRWS